MKPSFLKILSQEARFYTSVDGSFDRCVAILSIVAFFDYHYHHYLVALLVVPFSFFLLIEPSIAHKFKIPRLGYANYGKFSIKKHLILFLGGFCSVIVLTELLQFSFTNTPFWLKIVPLGYGKGFFGSFIMISFTLIAGLLVYSKHTAFYFFIFLSALALQYFFPDNLIFPYSYLLLGTLACSVSIIKLITFIKCYPILTAEAENE